MTQTSSGCCSTAMAAVKASDLIVGAGGGRKAAADGGGTSGGEKRGHLSEDWTRFGKKQILAVGQKRRHAQGHQEYEDDDDANEVAGDREDSSDEEEGRTSAVKEKKRKVRPGPAAAAAAALGSGSTPESDAGGVELSAEGAGKEPGKKKRKKKKGKKERARDRTAEGEKGDTTDAPIIAKADEGRPAEGEAQKDTTKSGTEDAPREPNDNAKPATKRRRKKVRSRQKNIRKDTRASDAKPAHLIVGGAGYAGRPLTKETKKKLGLEAERDNAAAFLGDADGANPAFDSGEWVGGDAPPDIPSGKLDGDHGGEAEDAGATLSKRSPKADEGKVLTKIGDCIVGNGDGAERTVATTLDRGEVLQSKGKKHKKKKKRKFKNLAV